MPLESPVEIEAKAAAAGSCESEQGWPEMPERVGCWSF